MNELNSIIARRDNDKLTDKEKDKVNKEYNNKLKNFLEFLKQTKDTKNAETIFQVLQSHGKIDECIKYAEIIEKFDTVIVHYINK